MTRQFDFGKNWVAFSRRALSKERVSSARTEFNELFRDIPLAGKSFLDIGFGQGLSLLFASEFGSRAVGCDINDQCREAFRRTAAIAGFYADIPVIIGSILDERIVDEVRVAGAGTYDVVHSWGVLHHTGAMHKAIKTACELTAPGGYLVIAIYNKHWSSASWKAIKWLYCNLPEIVGKLMIAASVPVIYLAKLIVTRKNPLIQERGMNFYFNIVDWVGGHPYEYASIDEIKVMVEQLGFTCLRTTTAQVPTGCNQFILKKNGF